MPSVNPITRCPYCLRLFPLHDEIASRIEEGVREEMKQPPQEVIKKLEQKHKKEMESMEHWCYLMIRDGWAESKQEVESIKQKYAQKILHGIQLDKQTDLDELLSTRLNELIVCEEKIQQVKKDSLAVWSDEKEMLVQKHREDIKSLQQKHEEKIREMEYDHYWNTFDVGQKWRKRAHQVEAYEKFIQKIKDALNKDMTDESCLAEIKKLFPQEDGEYENPFEDEVFFNE